MNTSLFIAARYLFARKSHNVINVISAICSIGMGVGTAALILIMSVYNGFEGLIKDSLSDINPDVLLSCREGKYFCPPDSLLTALEEDDAVSSINCILEDNIFFSYDGNQGVARARGVDVGYDGQSGIGRHVIEGRFSLYDKDVPQASIGASLAYKNGIHPRFLDPVDLFFPDGEGKVSVANPGASLNSSRVWPGSLFSITSTVDQQLMIVPLATMQELIGNDDLISGVEIRLKDHSDASVSRFIRNADLGKEYALLDRYSQDPSLFRMMKFEKFAIFMILIFVVTIIAFNIFGSLSMLIIEKKDDCASLRAMGASESLVRRIFILEGWMVSTLGMIGGLIAGVGLTLLQMKTGIVRMPGNFLVNAYPVVLNWTDVAVSCIGVALIGLFIALPASKARRD